MLLPPLPGGGRGSATLLPHLAGVVVLLCCYPCLGEGVILLLGMGQIIFLFAFPQIFLFKIIFLTV